ncbi:response regulator transcription factor [Chloroflexota bacterium]
MEVLIIEDDIYVVEVVFLCIQMQWPNVNIASTANGIEGIERIKSKSFDLVILDLNLPDINGFEVLKNIRTFSNVPVVILTVRGWEEDQLKGLNMGADDYIVKPFKPKNLIARINSVLRRSNSSSFEKNIYQGYVKENIHNEQKDK